MRAERKNKKYSAICIHSSLASYMLCDNTYVFVMFIPVLWVNWVAHGIFCCDIKNENHSSCVELDTTLHVCDARALNI